VTGVLFDQNGPADLSGWTMRFLAKATVNGVVWVIDSDTPNHGTCVNVFDNDGAGANVQVEWPIGSGTYITVPANKGRYRFEPATQGVAQTGLFEIEIECKRTVFGVPKTMTFPSSKENNPVWQIDDDIR